MPPLNAVYTARRKEALKNPRTKIATIIMCVCGLIIGAALLYLRIAEGKTEKVEITMEAYSPQTIDGLESSGVFFTSVLSTKENRTLNKNGYMILKTKKEYESFLSEYQDINVVYPEIVPVVDDWYAAGYQAVVFSTDAFELPVNLTAAGKYTDGEGTVCIVIETEKINPLFRYSADPATCKQVSVIVYLKAELLENATAIHFLIQA